MTALAWPTWLRPAPRMRFEPRDPTWTSPPLRRFQIEAARDIAAAFGLTAAEAALRLRGLGWKRRSDSVLEDDDRREMAFSFARIADAFGGIAR